MKIAPPELKTVRAFFFLTIGTIRMKNWKLTQNANNGEYHVSSPCEVFKNKNGNTQYESLIEISNPKIKDEILKLALEEYNLLKRWTEYADTSK